MELELIPERIFLINLFFQPVLAKNRPSQVPPVKVLGILPLEWNGAMREVRVSKTAIDFLCPVTS